MQFIILMKKQTKKVMNCQIKLYGNEKKEKYK